jgi:hypothetical protein
MTTTFSGVGLAEDFQDVIYDIDTVDTPLYNIAKKGRATAKLHEWQERVLSAPGENAVIEGADAGTRTYTPTIAKNNRCQLMEKVWKISSTFDAVKKYGRKSELMDQAKVHLRELKRDGEFAMTGSDLQTLQVGDGSTTADKMNCAQVQISADTTVDFSTFGTNWSDPATGGDLQPAEQAILAGMRSTYEEGGMVDTLLVNPNKVETIATFALQDGRRRDVTDKRLVNSVDIYDSPYGEISVVMGRIMDTSTVLGIDSDYWMVAQLQPTKLEKLAKTGHSNDMMYSNEWTLACLNSFASFVIENIPVTSS